MPSFPLRGVSLLKVGVHPPKQVVRLGFCPHQEGAPPLRPRVTFPTRGKSPKARQGLRPLESPSAWPPPFSRSLRCAPSRAGLPSATKIDRFATLSWWVNRSCFFLWFHRGNTLCFQSVARQIPYPRGCLKVSVPATNTARAEGEGIQGGPPPCAGGPGTRRFLAYLSQHLCCYFPLREKVGRGMGRSTHTREERRGGRQPSSHIGGRRDYRPAKAPPGVEGRSALQMGGVQRRASALLANGACGGPPPALKSSPTR